MRVFVGGVVVPPLAPLTAADFASEIWTEVSHWFAIGDLEEQVSVAQRTNPGPAQHKVKTGEVTVSDIEIICEHEPTDPGQAILLAMSAPEYQASHAFRIDDSDSATTPTGHYFIACVTGRTEIHGKADDPRRTRYTITVNSNVVHAPAP